MSALLTPLPVYRLGSMFSGTGGLDLAIHEVLDAEVEG